MCGIVGGSGKAPKRALDSIAHRGPDASGVAQFGGCWLGHVRLAILDLDPRSDQPFRAGRVTLSFNGELWNFRELRAELEGLGRTFVTEGDTEVVAHALDQWGRGALPRFNGMFAVAWHDGEHITIARDRFGEVPLHWAYASKSYWFASEVRGLAAAGGRRGLSRWVEPGTAVVFGGRIPQVYRWHSQAAGPGNVKAPAVAIRAELEAGCRARSISDVPVCTLLSGGLDSSAVAALLNPHVPGLVGYVAVMDDSKDRGPAREVAKAIGIDLVEVSVKPPTSDDLSSVVDLIEMPHKAQVEIGWACVQLADAMRADGFKVTFSGEGSDELWASYGFAYHGVKQHGWYDYRRDLFVGQHRKNFARCNKVFMSRGIECRLPFLHPGLVDVALSLSEDQVRPGGRSPSECKGVLQDAVRDLIPLDVIQRPKLAFQAGMGLREACAATLDDPGRFYRAEHDRRVGSRP